MYLQNNISVNRNKNIEQNSENVLVLVWISLYTIMIDIPFNTSANVRFQKVKLMK